MKHVWRHKLSWKIRLLRRWLTELTRKYKRSITRLARWQVNCHPRVVMRTRALICLKEHKWRWSKILIYSRLKSRADKRESRSDVTARKSNLRIENCRNWPSVRHKPKLIIIKERLSAELFSDSKRSTWWIGLLKRLPRASTHQKFNQS